MAEAVLNTANPGRSGHRLSLAGARIVYQAREKLATLMGVRDPRRVVFTGSCTEAINLVLKGLLRRTDRVVTTSMEHNAVARPLRQLEADGTIKLKVVGGDRHGFVSAQDIASACAEEETALVAVCHGSNVSGAVQDLPAIRAAAAGIPLLVDAAQTAGAWPLPVDDWGLDYVALSGHKGIGGPPGIGALCISTDAPPPAPLKHGGTGSRSEFDVQPDFLPDRLEAGTANVPGLGGLLAALEWREHTGSFELGMNGQERSARFLEGLTALERVKLSGPPTAEPRLPTFSVVLEGMGPGEAAHRLEKEFGIMVRSGLHCAPWAHRTLGTFPTGTVRLSFGPTTPAGAEDEALAALASLFEG